MLRAAIVVLAMAAISPAIAGPAPNAAHDLAQKFAGQAESVATAPTNNATAQPAQNKPVEQIAQKPTSPASAKSSPAPAVPATAKPFAKSTTETPTSEATTAKVAASERPPIDYEMDMLRRARAEQADRKATEKPTTATAEPPKPAAPPVAAKPDATLPAATSKSEPAPETPAVQVTPPTPAPTLTAAPAKVEPQKLVEAPAATKTTTAAPPAAAAAAAPVTAKSAAPAVQASVLLAIETGGASSKGDDATALDPIICIGDTCFLSAGLSDDAVKLSKPDALKLKSSNDASPDACRGKVGCVFRNVGLPKDALIQVVELGRVSSDATRTYAAEPDASCKSTDGQLACDNPIATADFRIWIVPEATAKTAGSQAIEDAVADSLPHRDIERDTDK